jgi:hypothetical protein
MKQEATLIRARLKTPRAAAVAGILCVASSQRKAAVLHNPAGISQTHRMKTIERK